MRHPLLGRTVPDLRSGWVKLLGALLVVLVLATAGVFGHFYLNGTLSGTQLGVAFAQLTNRTAAVLHLVLGSRRTLGVLAFATGLALGWLSAWQWMIGRHRRRSLLIADLRQGDMPFAEVVDHVRRHARPRVSSDATAVELILAAAGHGRISLWHQASSDALSRVPARHVRLAAAQIVELSARQAARDTWRSFLLLRAEIEHCWPSAATLPVLVSRAATVSTVR